MDTFSIRDVTFANEPATSFETPRQAIYRLSPSMAPSGVRCRAVR